MELSGAGLQVTASAADRSDDAIRQKAYEIFLSRGSADGSDVSDWLEAERQVRSTRESELI